MAQHVGSEVADFDGVTFGAFYVNGPGVEPRLVGAIASTTEKGVLSAPVKDVKINYSMFASNEEMYTKLLGGSQYDVLVPSDYMIERMIDENMLQPLDKSMIPNLANLADGVKGLSYDPDNTYSAPYFWGMVGIVYNKNNVDPADVESQGFDVLRNEKYKGHVFVYDSERDSFMMAFKALGYSMNTENEDEIQEAYQWLLDMDTY